MAKFNAVGFSVGVVIVIATFFIFVVGVILYFYWGDASAVKDALSTAASFFGGFATLGAAIIAAYLFNDWRAQHNKDIESQLIFKTLDLLDINYFGIKAAIDIIRRSIQYSDIKLDVRSTEFIQINLDPYHLKKISMYEKQIKKLNPGKNISIEFNNYYALYGEMVEMTKNRVSYYNDFTHRNLSSPSLDRLYDSSLFITDESLPINYLKIVDEYETAFEILIEKLTELNKAES